MKVRISWIEGSVIQEGDVNWVGICHKTKRAFCFKPRDSVSIIFIRDFYIGKNECGEGCRCLNFDCKLNKTNSESFMKVYSDMIPKEDREFLKKFIEKKKSFLKSVDFNSLIKDWDNSHVVSSDKEVKYEI